MEFKAPIGEVERDSGKIWPGYWFDATGYLALYSLGYHTGADLNLNYPYFDKDSHSKVFAMGDGKVAYADLYSKTAWGNLIIINHGIVDGKPLFSRYGHVEDLKVHADDDVTVDTWIANVGNGEGMFPYHLHFDISTTDILSTTPGHWPGSNKGLVMKHYVDPKSWLEAHGGEAPDFHDWYVIAAVGLRVREDHSTEAKQVGSLLFGSRVRLSDAEDCVDGLYNWGHISGGPFSGSWVAKGMADQSETYLSRDAPGL